jgi:hypothetical protein
MSTKWEAMISLTKEDEEFDNLLNKKKYGIGTA